MSPSQIAGIALGMTNFLFLALFYVLWGKADVLQVGLLSAMLLMALVAFALAVLFDVSRALPTLGQRMRNTVLLAMGASNVFIQSTVGVLLLHGMSRQVAPMGSVFEGLTQASFFALVMALAFHISASEYHADTTINA